MDLCFDSGSYYGNYCFDSHLYVSEVEKSVIPADLWKEVKDYEKIYFKWQKYY